MIGSPVKHRRVTRVTRRRLILGGISLAGALVLLWVVTQLYDAYLSHRAAQRHAAHVAIANQVAKQIGTMLDAPRAALRTLAEDPALLAALRSRDAEALTAIAERGQATIAGALRLRALPRGAATIDNASKPPLTYASLDMIGQAEHSAAAVGAELHLYGSADAYIALAQRVPASDEEVAGVLLLNLDPKLLQQAVDAVAIEDGVFEVRQLVRGSSAVVLRRSAGEAVDEEAAVAGISNTRWVVAVRGAASGTLGLGSTAIIAVFLIAGLSATGRWLWRRRGTQPGAEPAAVSVEYQGAIKAILDGTLAGLAHLLPGSTEPIPALDAPPVGEPTVAFVAAEVAPTRVSPSSPPEDHLAGDAQEFIDLTLENDTMTTGSETPAPQENESAAPASIFRSYDIRGVVGKTLTEEGVLLIGRALATIAAERGETTVVVARDGRDSSPSLQTALITGLRAAGCNVIDIGMVPTPVLYFATHYLDARSGVMITGSHNPSEYNGLKIVLAGETLSGEAIQAIRKRIDRGEFASGQGTLANVEIIPDYIRRISEEIPVTLGRPLSVVVDCGNGVPGVVAPQILRAIGHDVIELFCDVDGRFPNHHPDPSQPENLEALIEAVRDEGADLGLAFDGDGDRLGVVDADGNIIWPDRQMVLFSRDVISRNPGATIIYDVKCSGRLTTAIREAGGTPLMWKTGHSLLKAKMKETGALLAGEMSGHIFFKERWYGFDDALYAAARLLEILVRDGRSPTEVFAEIPDGVTTPELRLDMPEERHRSFMQQVMAAADFANATVVDIDGLRVDFPDGWGLIRPSNTTPCLVLRFEGDDAAALNRIQDEFRKLLWNVDDALSLPF